jgi:hypothetical protein
MSEKESIERFRPVNRILTKPSSRTGPIVVRASSAMERQIIVMF